MSNRLKMHNLGNVFSTKNRRPFVLIYSEEYKNKYDAFQIERFYKTAKGKKELLKKIINS